MSAIRAGVSVLRSAAVVAALQYTVQNSVACDPKAEEAAATALLAARHDAAEYEHVPWNVKKNELMIRNHALFDSLHGDDKVEQLELYKHKTKQEVAAVIKFGNTLNGYPGILHGGTAVCVSRCYECTSRVIVFSLWGW
jgi:hypothetical protein